MRTEREMLPTREQIEAITDLVALKEVADRVDRQAEKIEVDLEFAPGDEDWAARARGALTAHRICLGHLTRNIRRLERWGDKPLPPDPIAAADRKIAKQSAHAERLLAEAEAKRAKAERERVQLLERMTAFAARTSWLAAFHAAAAKSLDQATLSRISNAAHSTILSEMTRPVNAETNP